MEFKKIHILSALLCMSATIGTGYAYINSKPKHIESYGSYISGIQKGDMVRVEAVTDGDYHFLDEANIDTKTDAFEIKSAQILDQAKRYNLMITLQDNPHNAPTDISFIIDKKTGYIKTSVDGLSAANALKFSVNGEQIQAKKSTNSQNKTQFETVTLNDKNKQNICIDIGGYRGSSLSVCHAVKNTNIEQVALSFPSFTFSMPTFQLPGVKTFSNDIANNWDAAFKSMTAQVNTNQKQQTAAQGRFMDGKEEKEKTRDIQTAHAKAHNEFQSSPRGCKTISQSRGLKPTQQHARVVQSSLEQRTLSRGLASGENETYYGAQSDTASRLARIRTVYANPDSVGMANFSTATDKEMIDMDINYHELIGKHRTVAIDVEQSASDKNTQAMYAMWDNMFYAQANSYVPPSVIHTASMVTPYQNLRQYQGLRTFATRPAARILSKTASGPQDNPAKENIRASLKEQGYSDDQIDNDIGVDPSLNAQEEFLESRKYEDPNYHIEGSGEGATQAKRGQMQQAQSAAKKALNRNKAINEQMSIEAAALALDIDAAQQEINASILRMSEFD